MQDGIMEVLRQGLNPFLAMSDTWTTAFGSWAGVFQVCLLKEDCEPCLYLSYANQRKS